MVHKYSHGVEGKGSDVASQVKFTERYFDELAFKIYGDLMTKDEIKQMLDGKDFWFSSKEIHDRLLAKGREILGSETDAIPFTGQQSDAVQPAESVAEVVAKPRKAKTTAIKASLAKLVR